ncbi:MAG: catalase [Gammaproteobacteria bacterium]|nr:catalase [Gammaproteobacteria bacterium]
MITPSLPSNFANAVSPFSSVGRSPVGTENIEALNTPFKPVEELAESSRQQSRSSIAERAVLAEEQPQGVRHNGEQEEERQRQQQETQQQESKQQESKQREAEQQLIRELASRDREVRAHEQAHTAVGGALAGSPVYQFQRGPDGVSYAIGGEVPISIGQVAGDPEATLQNARRVQRAALAPAEPSPQDRRVAAQAAQVERQAQQEIVARAAEEREILAAELEAEREEKARQREEQQAELAQREQVRAQQQEAGLDDSVVRNNIDLNRRLIEIGVFPASNPTGGLLNLLA